jgi:diguanylate cyclase (GGDEF)-like protein/PAS domain S-box-containing protein
MAVLVAVGTASYAPARPAVTAAAVAVAAAAAWYGTDLIRLALAIHRYRHTFGPCRGSGFLGLTALASGLTTLATALVGRPWPAGVVIGTGGTVVVAITSILGLLLLPGVAPSVRVRLRRCLDGAGIGIFLFCTGWLLVVSPDGAPSGEPFTVTVVTCLTAATAVVAGARAVRYRPAAPARAAGAILATAGTAANTLAVAGGGAPAWLATATVAQITGPLLAAVGAHRAGTGPAPVDPADGDGTFAAHPLLVVPLTLALLAAVEHLVRGAPFDTTVIVLGGAGVAVLAAREWLATADVRRYAQRLTVREAHFRSLVAGSKDVTMVLDTDLVVRWQSPAAARQFGLSEQDVLGRPFCDLVHPQDAGRITTRLRAVLIGGTADEDTLMPARLHDGFGQWRDTESTISDQRATPEVAALVLHVRDIGDRKELERSLHRMAWTDPVTGLANRRKLRHAAGELREATGVGGALLLIELIGHQDVGSLRGPEAGDAVLAEAARRLRAGIGDADVAARLDGDEFAVLTGRAPVPAYALATRLVTVLSEPYHLPGGIAHLSAAAGVAGLLGGADVDDVLRHADLARRRAARHGRGSVECFDESIEAALLRRVTIEQELPGVIERGELDLVYQPVVDLRRLRPVGVEALLRWRNVRLGAVDPSDLIPAARRWGLASDRE